MSVVGRVDALWRYPVKSMRGELLDGATVTDAGIFGDRLYAVQDAETGYIASAKHPRRWAPLLECRATYDSEPRVDRPIPPVVITLPDGARVRSTDLAVHDRLSLALGRTVRLITIATGVDTLVREADRSPLDRIGSGDVVTAEPLGIAAPAGLFFDYAPLHVLTTATLAAFTASHPRGDFNTTRFRANIVVATTDAHHGFVENAWLGHSASIGDVVRVAMIDPCPRCVVTTLAQEHVAADAEVLRTIHRSNAVASITAAPGVLFPAVAGAYASTSVAGLVAVGDVVAVHAASSGAR
jgi:uncharacterized protein